MQLSRKKALTSVLLLIIITGALSAAYFLTQQPQNPDASAATGPDNQSSPENKQGLGLSPKKCDINGDNNCDKLDSQLFRMYYRTGAEQADLDNSGQVNTLDVVLFKMLSSKSN